MSVTPESVQQLLNSDDFGDRIRGINQLRQLEPKVAFEMVQPMVTDKNTRVRYAAVSQLDTIGKQDLDISLKLLRDRLLNDSEPDVQAVAADAIGGLKLTVAFDDLQQLYHQTSEWLIQFSIIAALGELGDPRGFELLKEALTSETNLVKTVAISALGELGDSRAVPLLTPFATDSDWQVRYRLVQALGRLGGSQAHSTLEKLAKDEVEQIAQEAKNNLASDTK
ncbi:MAG: phycobilisome degradation protein NblB [Xenococcaceae cyanobacterium]